MVGRRRTLLHVPTPLSLLLTGLPSKLLLCNCGTDMQLHRRQGCYTSTHIRQNSLLRASKQQPSIAKSSLEG